MLQYCAIINIMGMAYGIWPNYNIFIAKKIKIAYKSRLQSESDLFDPKRWSNVNADCKD